VKGWSGTSPLFLEGESPHTIGLFNNPYDLIMKNLDKMLLLFEVQNLIRVSQKKFQSISGNFFSIDPSYPAWNFLTRLWYIRPDHHAGENDLLLDKYPTVG
jgi:hypothetical protein